MGKREDKEMEEQYNKQSELSEEDDQQIDYDLRQKRELNLPSDAMPQDYYEYRKFVNLPESQSEFVAKIDKDVVFANLGGSKPTIEELRFQIGTIELFEGEFVEEIKIPRIRDGEFVRNNKGEIVYDIELRFDEAFRSCLNFLKAEYKFDIVASRALNGHERAAELDISSSSRIQKEINKKNNNSSKLGGFGGN